MQGTGLIAVDARAFSIESWEKIRYDHISIIDGAKAHRGCVMSEKWKHCSHCNAHFVPQADSAHLVCPNCGQALSSAEVMAGKTEWYFARNNKKVGPISAAQMKKHFAAGELKPTDMVLQSGARKWVTAGDVKEFFPRSIVPPIATTDSIPLRCAPARTSFDSRHDVLSEGQVVPEAANCVQCGMCSYNCPMEIDVRAHAWRGIPIRDSHCLTCSECVNRCPRGVLRFERISLFVMK
jgi:Fe-S oxidoreductase